MLSTVAATLAAVATGTLLAGHALAGEIRGSVLLAGAPPAPKKVPVTIDRYVCGNEKDAEDLIVSPAREVKNVVVWLQNPPPAAPPAPTTAAQIDQVACVYTPRVLLVPAGGTVEFLNSDRLLHNLHSRSTANPSFNRTQPRGRTIAMRFATPEFVRLDCDLHSWMRGWVVVAAHAFYALTDARGRFQLDRVPPGEYTLRTWHETLGETTRTITVGDTPAAVTVELKPG